MTSSILFSLAMAADLSSGLCQAPSQGKLAAPTSQVQHRLFLAGQDAGPVAVEGNLSHSNITFKIGMGQSKVMVDWMNQFYANKPVPKTAVLHAMNSKFESMHEQVFFDAFITETTLPALDASNKEPQEFPVKLTLKARTSTRRSPRLQPVTDSKSPAKRWTPSNFRFKLGSLPCERVSKIGAITIKSSTPKQASGIPGPIEFCDLKLTMPISEARLWRLRLGETQWKSEKTGAIIYLAPNLKSELFHFNLELVAAAEFAQERVGGRTTRNMIVTVPIRPLAIRVGSNPG